MRIRAGFVTESAFEPLFGAKFSIRTILSLRRQLPKKRSRGGLNGLANVVNDPFDHGGVLPLGHDADQRLSARFADQQPALALQLSLGGRDTFPDAVGLQRLAAAIEADILQQLRKRLELAQE